MKPPPRLPPPVRRAAAAAALVVALLLLLPHASAACTPPYEAQPGPFSLRVAPGETREFSGGLTIAPGERALIEGTLRVAGGVQINGTLFLSSTASSNLSAEWVAVGAGGALVAGSEACPLPVGVVATVHLRDGGVHPTAGRKALAVLPGGTLEVSCGQGRLLSVPVAVCAAGWRPWAAGWGGVQYRTVARGNRWPPCHLACWHSCRTPLPGAHNSPSQRTHSHPLSLQLHGSKGLALPWTRLAATAAAGASELQLDPSKLLATWAPGDRLAVASTDFDPYQTEASMGGSGGGGSKQQNGTSTSSLQHAAGWTADGQPARIFRVI